MYQQYRQLRSDLEASGFFVENVFAVRKHSYIVGLFCRDDFAVEMNYGRSDLVHLFHALDLLDFLKKRDVQTRESRSLTDSFQSVEIIYREVSRRVGLIASEK